MSGKRAIHAPRGSERSCKGWHQEAAMRMLMNNLDPDVAENPDQLVVYGGTGRAARSWEAFEAIVRSLRELENDETLLVQSARANGVDDVWPNDCRLMDLHRQPGNCAGNVRNFCRGRPETFRRFARRKIRTNRWPWRDGWCATARRDNERCGFSRSRSRSCADREETEEWILRQERAFTRRSAEINRSGAHRSKIDIRRIGR